MEGFIEGIWHPLIDMNKCTNCDFCYEFCPKGVFAKNNGNIIVKNHNQCVDGCHWCEWKCPTDFVKYVLENYIINHKYIGEEELNKD